MAPAHLEERVAERFHAVDIGNQFHKLSLLRSWKFATSSLGRALYFSLTDTVEE